MHTDTSAPQSNLLAAAASFSGIPGSSTTVATVHNPSPVACIKPLKVATEKKKAGEDDDQSTSDLSSDSDSSEVSDSYEAVDSLQKIHLTGAGKFFRLRVFVYQQSFCFRINFSCILKIFQLIFRGCQYHFLQLGRFVS